MPTVVEIQGAKVRGSFEPGNYSIQTMKYFNINFIFKTLGFSNMFVALIFLTHTICHRKERQSD